MVPDLIAYIFGCPNSGKTTLRNALSERHKKFVSRCIDDYRKEFSNGTVCGEAHAQTEMTKEITHTKKGFFESSGTGSATIDATTTNKGRNQKIIVLYVPVNVSVDRMKPDKYDNIPFPFKGDDVGTINRIYYNLYTDLFPLHYPNIPVIYIDGTLPLSEQIAIAEDFLGL